MTLDAFAHELVEAFAPGVGVALPLRLEQPGGLRLIELAGLLCKLLQRSPAIARALVRHYPVVVCDEHQDARVDQHQIVELLRSAGLQRLRIFGDPMQAIYDFEGASVEWAVVCLGATVEELDEPHRWSATPELGAWILAARSELALGKPLPLGTAPPCVVVDRVAALPDGPPPKSRAMVPSIATPLWRATSGRTGSLAVLVRNHDHVLGVHSSLRGTVHINEGSDLSHVYDAVAAAEAAAGNPKQLIAILLDLVEFTCTGLTKAIREKVEGCCQTAAVTPGRNKVIVPLLDILKSIYVSPDLAVWCDAVLRIGNQKPCGLKVRLPEAYRMLRLLARESPPSFDSIQRIGQMRRQSALMPSRVISTIHKAKGREFDHVVIAYCSRQPFPLNPASAKVLYVAISRATRTLRILASAARPSAFLG